MALNFQSFKGAEQAKVPDLINATAQQGELNQAAHAANLAQKQKTAIASMDAYDKFTGEDTPIRDTLRRLMAESDGSAVPVEDQSVYSNANGDIIGESGVDQYDSMSNLNAPTATDIPLGMDTATGAVDPALAGADSAASAADLSAALRAGETASSAADAASAVEGAAGAADAAGGVADSAGSLTGGVPVIGIGKGIAELAAGDTAGAASTGVKTGLSMMGPYGMVAAALLSLVEGYL